MAFTSMYREIGRKFVADIHKISAEAGIPVDKAFTVVAKTWEMEAQHEAEMVAERQSADQDKAAMSAALPNILAQFGSNIPPTREILEKLGYPPTRRNIGYINWKRRQLTFQPDAMPAE